MVVVTRLAQYGNNKGLTQSRAIAQANQGKVRLLSNTEFDHRLVKTDTWKSEKEVYPAWTGTMVAYSKPGSKLGTTLTYTDPNTNQRYVFDSSAYNGEKNILLAINHGFDAAGQPFFTLKDGKDMVVQINDASQLKVVEAFPSKNGWYMTDAAFGIPTGSEVGSGRDDARYLYRLDGGYVGLLARDYGDGVRRDVYADGRPSGRFGVLADKAGATAPAAAILAPDFRTLVSNAEKAMAEFGDDPRLAPVRDLIEAVRQ